jgi:hypothetical protein
MVHILALAALLTLWPYSVIGFGSSSTECLAGNIAALAGSSGCGDETNSYLGRRSVAKRSWKDASALAESFVSKLNLKEKVAMVTGNIDGVCDGNINSIPRLNFSGLCLHDGPAAIRVADLATLFPAGVTVAATWDKSLMYARGLAMGEEFRGKGSHIILGWVM